MAITTLDGALAGMRPAEDFLKVGGTMEATGVMHSFFYSSGRPGAAAAPTPGLGGAALTSYAGQLPWTNPASGNSYLGRFNGAANTQGTLFLCDRLWHNSGFTITTTTAQTVNSATWPARDRDGSTNGESVLVALEVSGATGNGSAVTNTTLSYTNQAGTSGRTAAISSFPATAAAGTFVPFQLQAGDTGIRSVQSLTLGTTYTSGTVHLVAYRVLDLGIVPAANIGFAKDALATGFLRLYNDTVPFLVWLATGTGATTVLGQITVSQG